MVTVEQHLAVLLQDPCMYTATGSEWQGCGPMANTPIYTTNSLSPPDLCQCEASYASFDTARHTDRTPILHQICTAAGVHNLSFFSASSLSSLDFTGYQSRVISCQGPPWGSTLPHTCRLSSTLWRSTCPLAAPGSQHADSSRPTHWLASGNRRTKRRPSLALQPRQPEHIC